uniref:Nibrin n=1 Tax=Astyanax mexicanus TaxID=7994 RepID=A0A8B9KHD2_ASTMX
HIQLKPLWTFYLLPGKEYVVGRKNCDILLANDQSISRVHAQLTMNLMCFVFMLFVQTVTLKDSSKYGTFVNDEQLTTNSTKTVHDGDRLTFGVFQSKFRCVLKLNSMVVCSSCVDNEGKAALSKAVQSVGGRLVNSWSPDCTHLVMPTVKVTIKTICALLCCRPIVKAEFFTELSRAVQRKEKVLPAAQNFKPEIDEPSLTKQDVDLDPRPERKSLFRDKTFVFLNVKQMKRLSQAIICGGGVTQLLEEGSLPLPLLQSTGTCVIDVGAGASQALVPPATKKWVDSVGQVLHRY